MVLILTLLSPNWLKIEGIGPCWAVLWLLPFSLEMGSWWGSLAALFLAFLLDSLSIGGGSYIPSLLFLSLWWGRLGKQHKQFELNLNLGLLAFLGTAVVGISIWAQKLIFYSFPSLFWFNAWAFHTFLAELIITALIAPLLCSWLLLAWKSTRLK